MTFLAQGVEVPQAHSAEIQDMIAQDLVDGEQTSRFVPLRVFSEVEQPDDAFAAVHYRDHWFHIANTDPKSKQVFGLLNYLFQLQAPKTPVTAPVLTVPTG